MFTGIIEEIGSVQKLERTGISGRITIKAKKILTDIKIGDSIAVNGVCLTAADLWADQFTADVMQETLDKSSLGSLCYGKKVNLERAMKSEGRFGGHIVSGHIDGVGNITQVKTQGNAVWYTIKASEKILRYIVEKGSIAIDGTSLTVAAAGINDFSVSVIPHTLRETVIGKKKAGDTVNIENDILGKYIEKLVYPKEANVPKDSGVTKEQLLFAGF